MVDIIKIKILKKIKGTDIQNDSKIEISILEESPEEVQINQNNLKITQKL